MHRPCPVSAVDCLIPRTIAVCTQQRGSGGDKYEYVSIADMSTKGDNNIFGVVVSCTPPKPTKSVDMMSRVGARGGSVDCTWPNSVARLRVCVWQMNIIDPSRPTLAVPVVVFARHPRQHPKCTQLGDVVRAHRLTLKPYQQSYQLLAKYAWRLAGSRCACIHATTANHDCGSHNSVPRVSAGRHRRLLSSTRTEAATAPVPR